MSKDSEISSKARVDFLGFGEIGGVGQLIYHSFRFVDYGHVNSDSFEIFVRPICTIKNPPDLTPRDDLTGKEILTSLCELARRIDDFNEKGYDELIIEWCKENMHPYSVDYLYESITEDTNNFTEYYAEAISKDGIFSLNEFMNDLEKLYNAARFYVALDATCYADNTLAYNMYTEGRHFEGYPFFEKYKYPIIDKSDIDYSSAKGDMIKEMMIESEYKNQYWKEHKEEIEQKRAEGEFAIQPYDDYHLLRNRLIELIPDFRLRLKIDPKSNKPVFSADINSVFDIAWYTMARMLTEEPPLEKKGKESKHPEGIMICCHNCGRFFIRNSSHHQYCDRLECQKARNAKNQREYRKRKAIQKAQAKKNSNG